MILSANTTTAVSLTGFFGHTVEGLDCHQECRKKNNKANTEGNVRVALEFLHQVEKANLSHHSGKEANGEANHGIVRDEKAKDYEGGSGCEAGEENHAGR